MGDGYRQRDCSPETNAATAVTSFVSSATAEAALGHESPLPPRARAGLRAHRFDTSSEAGASLLLDDRGRAYQASPAIHTLLSLMDGSRDVEALAAETSRLVGAPVSSDAIKRVIQEVLLPAGLLHTNEPEHQPGTDDDRVLSVRRELIGVESVRALAHPLRILFHRWVLRFAILAIVAAHTSLYVYRPQANLPSQIGGWDYVIALLLVFLGILYHELGHAAAAQVYGAKHGPIGIGLYAILPVFYTDVSDAWRLPRHARTIIDLGGIYFQLLWATLLSTAFFMTERSFLMMAVLWTNLSVLLSLNPFLRFDGYWVVSDVLGIPNLRRRSREILIQRIRSFLGRDNATLHSFARIHGWRKNVVLAYAALRYSFIAVLTAWVVAVVLPSAIARYPDTMRALERSILDATQHGEFVVLLRSGLAWTLSTILIGFCAFFAYGLAVRLTKQMSAAARSRPPRNRVS
jgi:putative peptide zinc metalloprotease protein